MAKINTKIEKSRLRSSNFTVVISIALVLFLLGLIGLIIVNAQSYADHVKEQLKLEAFFVNEYDPKKQDGELEKHKNYIDSLRTHEFVKSTIYISKDDAYEIAKNQMGIKDHSLFEEKIYPASVQVTLKSDFVSPEKMDSIKKIIEASPMIDEAVNDQELMTTIYDRIDQIRMWLLILAGIFLVIAISLINNAIRLRIYAKRFSIKTMQLVGARRRFIIKPFMIQSALLGFLGALLAILLLGVLWYLFAKETEMYWWNNDFYGLIILLLIIGIFIALLSTAFSAWKYLRLRTDQLY